MIAENMPVQVHAHDTSLNLTQTPSTKSTSPPFALSQATTVAEVESALHDLRTHHSTITARLDASLAQHEDLLRQLRRLDLSRARLGTLATAARAISHGMLSSAASTASRISTAVEQLDLEQARVNDTLAVVEQVTELKACVLGVVGSMGATQDWETAAEYISRAARIPDDVVDSGFAEVVVPTAEVPDPPRVTLDASAAALCKLFERGFEQAVEEGDSAKIARFFKMFPLIQRAKEGLEAYGRYVCQGVALRARARLQAARGVANEQASRGGFVYANALTKLFEHIAQVVDGHSPLVERHYGEGTMVQVMQRLHGEADVQGGIVLDTWYDERGIERKLTDVKSYAYSFLVQSFMSAQKSAGGGTGKPTQIAPGNGDDDDDNIDTKEIDQVLSEIVAMLSSWSLYVVFISSRTIPITPPEEDSSPLTTLKPPPFLLTSALPRKVSKTLIDPFKTLATFFLRRSVERAFQLDESPVPSLSLLPNTPITANPPFITSAVDDVMYVVNQVLGRALATSQADIVTSTAATVARVLGSDFIGMTQRKMRDESYPKPVVQGGLPPEDKVLAFMVLINNLDVAVDYIKRIVHTHTDVPFDSNFNSQAGSEPEPRRAAPRSLATLFPLNRDAHAVRSALSSLESSFSTKARDLLGDGIAVLFAKVLRPRLATLLSEIFRDKDAEYAASFATAHTSAANGTGTGNEDDNASTASASADEEDAPANRSLRPRLQAGWDSLTRPLKRILTAPAYDRLLSSAVAFISQQLERRIWSYAGAVGTMGAVALERDVLDVVGVVTRGERFGLREGFGRCVEVVTVMNLEEGEELDGGEEDGDGEGGKGVLSVEERERARAIVVHG